MANRYRGEVDIMLGGKQYTMRPTFAALAEIEHRLGKPITDIAIMQGGAATFGIGELATIVQCGIKGAGQEPPNMNDIGEAIASVGVMKFARMFAIGEKESAIIRFLVRGIAGDEDEKKREEPAARKKK